MYPIIAVIAATISIKAINITQENTLGKVITKTQEISESFNVENHFERTDNLPITNVVIEESGIFIDTFTILLAIWCIVMLYMSIRYIFGVNYILKIRNRSTKEIIHKYSLFKSILIETPFSFFKSIFINEIEDQEKYDLIIKHEVAHIKKLHYLDKLISQIYITLSWFNPIVWKIRRELEYIHEFEADYNVLNGDCDKKKYKQFIYEEILHDLPAVTNGFNGSLVKERFLQMRNNYKTRYKKLRNILTFPAVALILTLTSFTYVKGDVIVSNTDNFISKIDNVISLSESFTFDWYDNSQLSKECIVNDSIDTKEDPKSQYNYYYI
ncbi:MAG: hypothetical protein R3Y26_08785 [Rikenellaceae bacterium]